MQLQQPNNSYEYLISRSALLRAVLEGIKPSEAKEAVTLSILLLLAFLIGLCLYFAYCYYHNYQSLKQKNAELQQNIELLKLQLELQQQSQKSQEQNNEGRHADGFNQETQETQSSGGDFHSLHSLKGSRSGYRVIGDPGIGPSMTIQSTIMRSLSPEKTRDIIIEQLSSPYYYRNRLQSHQCSPSVNLLSHQECPNYQQLTSRQNTTYHTPNSRQQMDSSPLSLSKSKSSNCHRAPRSKHLKSEQLSQFYHMEAKQQVQEQQSSSVDLRENNCPILIQDDFQYQAAEAEKTYQQHEEENEEDSDDDESSYESKSQNDECALYTALRHGDDHQQQQQQQQRDRSFKCQRNLFEQPTQAGTDSNIPKLDLKKIKTNPPTSSFAANPVDDYTDITQLNSLRHNQQQQQQHLSFNQGMIKNFSRRNTEQSFNYLGINGSQQRPPQQRSRQFSLQRLGGNEKVPRQEEFKLPESIYFSMEQLPPANGSQRVGALSQGRACIGGTNSVNPPQTQSYSPYVNMQQHCMFQTQKSQQTGFNRQMFSPQFGSFQPAMTQSFKDIELPYQHLPAAQTYREDLYQPSHQFQNFKNYQNNNNKRLSQHSLLNFQPCPFHEHISDGQYEKMVALEYQSLHNSYHENQDPYFDGKSQHSQAFFMNTSLNNKFGQANFMRSPPPPSYNPANNLAIPLSIMHRNQQSASPKAQKMCRFQGFEEGLEEESRRSRRESACYVNPPQLCDIFLDDEENCKIPLEDGRYQNSFEDQGFIGKGGFGICTKVIHKLDSNFYAIKKIRIFIATDQDIKEHKVYREIMALPQLNHKNVVRYFGCWAESIDVKEKLKIHQRVLQIQKKLEEKERRKQKLCKKSTFALKLEQRQKKQPQDKHKPSKKEFKIQPKKIPREQDEIIVLNHNGLDLDDQLNERFDAKSFITNSPAKKAEENSDRSCLSSVGDDDLVIDSLIDSSDQDLQSSKGAKKERHGKKAAKVETEDDDEDSQSEDIDSELILDSDADSQDDSKKPAKQEKKKKVSKLLPSQSQSSSAKSDEEDESDDEEEEENSDDEDYDDEEDDDYDEDTSTQNQNGIIDDDALYEFAEKKQTFISIDLMIQMEYCSGKSLQSLLEDRQRTIDRAKNFQYFKQLLSGVKHIHQNGFIHRDIKPANIFIEGNTLKVGDFGLARRFKKPPTYFPLRGESSISPVNLKKLSQMGSRINLRRKESAMSDASMLTSNVGTSTYLSPEQDKNQSYNEKVDIYALGLILCELYHKFGTFHERTITFNDLKNKGILPKKIAGEFPVESKIILMMVNGDPEQRPSAENLLKHQLFLQWEREVSETTILSPRAPIPESSQQEGEGEEKLSLNKITEEEVHSNEQFSQQNLDSINNSFKLDAGGLHITGCSETDRKQKYKFSKFSSMHIKDARVLQLDLSPTKDYQE